MLPKLSGLKVVGFCKCSTLFNEIFVAFSETSKENETNARRHQRKISDRCTKHLHKALSEAIEKLRILFFW